MAKQVNLNADGFQIKTVKQEQAYSYDKLIPINMSMMSSGADFIDFEKLRELKVQESTLCEMLGQESVRMAYEVLFSREAAETCY